MKKMLNCFLSGWAMLIGIGLTTIPVQGFGQGQESGAARAIIVFDASGSMWGEVSGGVKIDIAKKVVSEMVTGLDPAMELGLIAYGHRSKGDCADIELLVEPKAGSAGEILKAVMDLQPKGKTPLTDAVMQAAQFLKFTEAKASVILVSDGVETCDRDPCLAAEELERLGVDFTCHVIGFDLKAGESSDLECLAQKTGGMFLPASDAGTLKTSLDAAMKQVVKPSTVLVVEPKKSSGGDLIEGVSFQLFAAGGGETAMATGSGGRWVVELEKAGAYTISAQLADKVVEVEADVPAGETVTREVVFAETGLKAVAYDTEGGRAFEEGVSWDLFGPADAEGNRPKVAYSYAAQPFMKVDPGSYLLQARRGSASASVEVTVEAGAPLEVAVILGSGTLKLRAVTAEGSPPIEKDLGWDVYGAADTEGNRKKLAYSYAAQPVLTLPAGPGLVTVQYGNASGQAEVVVEPGKTLEVVVVLGSGTLKLSAVESEGGTAIGKDLGWDVYGPADAEGNRTKLAYSYAAQPVIQLPAGPCLITVTYGNARGQMEAEVKGGQLQELVVTLGSGKLKLSVLMEEGGTPVSQDVGWDVYGPPDVEGNRKKLAYSYAAQPTFSLPAGECEVHVKVGNASVAKTFLVEAGQTVEETMVLGAGKVRLSAIPIEGAEPISKDLGWDIYGAPNAEGDRSKLSCSYSATPEFSLPSGTYLATVQWGNAAAQQEVVVESGKLAQVTILLNAGTLALSAIMGEGADPVSNGLGWDVYGAPNAEGERGKITYSYEAQPRFRLKEGNYLVTVNRGNSGTQAELEVKAGTMVTSVLNLNAGIVKASSAGGGGWDLYGSANAEGQRPKIGYSYEANPTFYLPAGKVLIVRSNGDKRAEKEVEIQANQLIELTLDAE